MIINNKIFSLPPYVSTSWNNVHAIHMKGSILVVTLASGDTINIPGLKPETLEMIFTAHATYLESDAGNDQLNHPKIPPNTPFAQRQNTTDPSIADAPFRFGFGLGPMDGLGSALQHNPAQSNAPELPKEILQKIGAIAKIISPEDINALPKPEPHCNCVHCQIARAIAQNLENLNEAEQIDETVTDEELNFQQWEISQTGDKLFTVINRLDTKEKYSVYLGHPIGCTCGKSGCEHILAVLKS